MELLARPESRRIMAAQHLPTIGKSGRFSRSVLVFGLLSCLLPHGAYAFRIGVKRASLDLSNTWPASRRCSRHESSLRPSILEQRCHVEAGRGATSHQHSAELEMWTREDKMTSSSASLPWRHLKRSSFMSQRTSHNYGSSSQSPLPPASSAPSTPGTFEAGIQRWCDRATSAFPLWVLAAALVGLWRPGALAWFGADLITAALATTMVCMGMTLRVDDFKGIARRPGVVLAGVTAQYTFMPLLGFSVGKLFKLPPALAAGVTLVGCCPGGTASNLVTLIANGDVALSVAMTSVSTLLAAALTGPLTKVLVGALVDINAATLMRTTAQVVFLPIAMGLFLNTYAAGFTRRLAPYTPLLSVALVAMICGSVVAANCAVLLGSGAALVGAIVALHVGGFTLGYGGMRILGFTRQEARTASIEVGMQNSALAVVLAQRGLPDPLSAIPGAVSATCHSLVGSALAAFWRTRDRKASAPGRHAQTQRETAVTAPSEGRLPE